MKKHSSQPPYSRRMEIAFICSLSLLISLFYSFKTFEFTPELNLYTPGPIMVEKIIAPEKERPAPRPHLPEIPVAGPEDEFLDNVTIDPYDRNLIKTIENLTLPDPPDTNEVVPFCALSKNPKLIDWIQPEYPGWARGAGIQGTVLVEVLIGKNGLVENARIISSHPVFDKAALDAVKQFRFSPAMQRDKNVRVKISVPIEFRLR